MPKLNVPKPVLRVDNLSVYRDTQMVLWDISFSLDAGEDTAIIGPNGAGKSTLVKALLGILPHQTGEIWFMGQPLSRVVSQGSQSPRSLCPIQNPPEHKHSQQQLRQQIAYLPQNFLCDRRIPITVEEVVGLGWDPPGISWPWHGHRQRRHAIRHALSQVDAWQLRHQMISTLSGGETKRVLLAYCLVRPRKLLILDEAPAGLDARSEADFYHLLDELKREQGWAILQVSHNLDMVRRNCDRVICLNQTICCQGQPTTTLSDENLSVTYSPKFVRYRHSH